MKAHSKGEVGLRVSDVSLGLAFGGEELGVYYIVQSGRQADDDFIYGVSVSMRHVLHEWAPPCN